MPVILAPPPIQNPLNPALEVRLLPKVASETARQHQIHLVFWPG